MNQARKSGTVDSRSPADRLAEDLASRLDGPPRSIVYLSRNDLEPARALEARFPATRVTIWTKADFQGLGPAAILGKLRSVRPDLFVLHDRREFQERLADLYRLIASAVRAGRRFLVAADVTGGQVEEPWTIEEVRPATALPGLAGRLLSEAAATAWLLFRTPLSLGSTEPAAAGARQPFVPKPRYRIAYLRTEPLIGIRAGGSISHIAGVAGGMRAAGHELVFLSPDVLPGIAGKAAPLHLIRPRNAIRVFDEAAMIDYHHQFVREGRAILSGFRPDILYQRHSVFSAAGAQLSRATGAPLILEANHSEVHARLMWSRLQLRDIARRMERHAFAGATVIVAVSEIGKEQLVKFGADPARVLVNPNGVDPETFHPGVSGAAIRQRHGFGEADVVVGFLGTFTRWHGVLFLADAVARLVAQHPRVRFLFMGDGDLRSEVEERIDAAGCAGAARFTGLIAHGEVPAHLAACDILVSPHLPFEDGTPFFGSPTKLFEYMAMGKAVVAARLGQIGDVIRDGENGLLFTPGSPEEFLDRMSRAIADRDLRLELGASARRRVVESYTWQKNVERVMAFLEKRLSGRGEA